MATLLRGKRIVGWLTGVIGAGSLAVTGLMSGFLLGTTHTASGPVSPTSAPTSTAPAAPSNQDDGEGEGDDSQPTTAPAAPAAPAPATQAPAPAPVQPSQGGQSSGTSSGS